MGDKLYIEKFIRDDNETLEFDGVEIYLNENNKLLRRPDPNTTAVEYTGADGGEMIRQKASIYEQEVNGLIIPKTTEYWALTAQLSKFFKFNHTYKIVYKTKAGSMFAISNAWISSGLQIEPVPYETYSEWSITFAIGDVAWTEYAENGSGQEVYSNTVTLPLLTANAGGEMWESPITPTGKNLFSVGFSQYPANLTNSIELTNPNNRIVHFTFPSPLAAGHYIFSGKVISITTTKDVRILVWDSQGAAFTTNVNSVGEFSFPILASATLTKIDILIDSLDDDGVSVSFDNLQLESGSSVSDYEPYGNTPVGGGEMWDNVGAEWESGAGGVQTVNIDSTQAVYPVWVVEGPCTNPTLQNNTTDTVASFDGTVASGQTLTVDFAAGVAYLNSALVTRYVSGLVSLAPGANTVGFNSDGGSTSTSTISWNNTIN